MGENKDTFEAWQKVRESRTSSDPIRIVDTHNNENDIVLLVKGRYIGLSSEEAWHFYDLLKVALIDHEAFEASHREDISSGVE